MSNLKSKHVLNAINVTWIPSKHGHTLRRNLSKTKYTLQMAKRKLNPLLTHSFHSVNDKLSFSISTHKHCESMEFCKKHVSLD